MRLQLACRCRFHSALAAGVGLAAALLAAGPAAGTPPDDPAQATPVPTERVSLVAPGATMQAVATGYGFAEGPAVASDGTLYFSDVAHSRIHALSPSGDVTLHRANTERANGLYFDADGALVVCVMGGRRLERDDLSGGLTTLADEHEGQPLAGPNDVWVHPEGGIYFSDPDFQGTSRSSVFYLPPGGGELVRVISDLGRPNGVIGTPAGDALYVADYGGHTWRYEIAPDGTLADRTMVSFRPADGLTLDERGNVYLASERVRIHGPDGTELESIAVPEVPSNLTFGGPDGRTLFITAETSVYAIRMAVRGAFAVPGQATATATTPPETATATATATSSPEPSASPSPAGQAPIFLPYTLRLSGRGPAPTPVAPTPEASPTPGLSPTPAFAPYVPVPVDVVADAPDYVPDLARVSNPRVLGRLSEPQREKLAASGFVVVPAAHEQFFDLYKHAAASDTPAFVTTDALLHAYHILHLNALRGLEEEVLVAELDALTAAMLRTSAADRARSPEALDDAAFRTMAFFSVAARLLDPEAALPPGVEDVVDRELALIDAHAGVAPSPIFGYDEDYSQYVPRGHYTGTADLRRYFRAMMWYGRIGFRLDPELPVETSRRETRQALLIVRALLETPVGDGRAVDLWDHLYDVTAFFVGTADDLTVHDYADLAADHYGRLPTAEDLADGARLDAFMARARTLRPPAILNTPIRPGQDKQSATMGFRFMGQRYIPDSDIFQQLVYDEVAGTYEGAGRAFTTFDGVRSFPRGLDVPAALGSARALEILDREGDTAYGGYREQLESVQAQFGSLPEARWSSNLYWSWLASLRPLLHVRGEGFPFFMRSAAWTDKSLQTWLGSWAQRRHDSILYAKPTMPGPTGVPGEPRGYVEPNPWLFARLAGLTSQAVRGLDARGLLSPDLGARFGDLEALLRTLTTIAEKELLGEALSDAEFDAIRRIGLTLEHIARVGPDAPDTDKQIAVVADIHTVPMAGLVLEEGVGDAFEIYVIVPEPDEDGHPREDRQIVTLGGVFSYYEFKWPMADRLTDQAWQAMDPRPPRPGWTESFIVGE